MGSCDVGFAILRLSLSIMPVQETNWFSTTRVVRARFRPGIADGVQSMRHHVRFCGCEGSAIETSGCIVVVVPILFFCLFVSVSTDTHSTISVFML